MVYVMLVSGLGVLALGCWGCVWKFQAKRWERGLKAIRDAKSITADNLRGYAANLLRRR